MPMDQLSLAVPIMDLATKATLIVMTEVASAVMTVLQPQEGLYLLCLSTLFVCIFRVVTWLRTKKPLPVPILYDIPHITLEFGPVEEGGPPCPGIGMMVDTCAALNTLALQH